MVAATSLRTSEKSHAGRVVIKAHDGAKYIMERVIGSGSFGVVFQATCVSTGGIVAIKRVVQDKRFKVRSCLRAAQDRGFFGSHSYSPSPFSFALYSFLCLVALA